MSIIGHCNCEAVSVELKVGEKKLSSMTCYCTNCARAGAGYSINYMVDQADVKIKDPKGALQTYVDTKTTSGKPMDRRFCDKCGSPILSQTTDGKTTGKVFLKATIFDEQTAPFMELYTASRGTWQPAIAGTIQK
uniref:CENP-V/GFA domain-containing protein n=1 Tax=Bionectria ochroleuca TaxID=29856 RepID=A0A8H7KD56_BIOOC